MDKVRAHKHFDVNTPKKKPSRKYTDTNFGSTSTLPESSSKSLAPPIFNAEQNTFSEEPQRVLMKSEHIKDAFKSLLVDSGLVNDELQLKMNYFFGPYEAKNANRSKMTRIEPRYLKHLLRCNKNLPRGAPKKELWVAVLEHISRTIKYRFRNFVASLGPASFPYLKVLCERACTTGLDGGHQATKLPAIEQLQE